MGTQRNADLAMEWAILVLGLAGVVAIVVPFAHGYSPWAAASLFLPVSPSGAAVFRESFSSSAGAVSAIGGATAFMVFLMSPLISLAQLSRCLGRLLSRAERAILVAVAVPAALSCIGWLVFDLYARVSLEDVRVGIGAWQLTMAAVLLWAVIILALLRVRKRLGRDAVECVLLSTYVGGVTTWATLLAELLETMAAVAGFACVVYAVSVWRRVEQGRRAGAGPQKSAGRASC